MNTRTLAIVLGAFVVAFVAAVLVAAAKAEDAASSPIVPPGGWELVLVVAAMGAFTAYVAAVLLLRDGGPLAPIIVIVVVLQLIPLLGPTLLSRDVLTYWAYGRVGAVHDANPYDTPPGAWPDDPATIRMGSSWREQPTLYGPAFTALSEAIANLAGDDERRAELLFRWIASLSVIAIVALAAVLARNRALAAALVGLNPLVALHFGGGGHNDALMMALVLAALALHERRRTALAGLAWALASLVKWVPLAFLALVALGDRKRHERRLLTWTAASLVGLAAVATIAYGTAWFSAAERLSEQARRTSSIGLAGWLADLGLSHRPTVLVIGLLTLVAAAWLGTQAWRGRVRLGLAGVLLAALQGWLNPWYALWGLSLSAAEEDRTAQVLAVALSGLLLSDALPL
jgi:alpha-1,6-mannosyltransferase